jgi:hypothetical protein
MKKLTDGRRTPSDGQTCSACQDQPSHNFKVNLITHLEVIALFQSNFKNVNTFHPLFQKQKKRAITPN